MANDLDDYCSPKLGILTGELNMSTQCKTIKQGLNYVEFILNGSNAKNIFFLGLTPEMS